MIGQDTEYIMASNNVAPRITQTKRCESAWDKIFPLISDATTAIILDTLEDARFSDCLFVVGPPYLRSLVFCPLYYQDIVIGWLTLGDTSRKTSFSMAQIELLSSFGRIVTEIISCEAKQRRDHEIKFLEVLNSWPRNLSGSFESILSSFRGVDSNIYNVLALLSDYGDEKAATEQSLEGLSQSLAEMHVSLDVMSAVGMMMRDLMSYCEATALEVGSPSAGLKKAAFSQLITDINTAVEDFGCDQNFKLTIDPTAESLVTIKTFPDSIVSMFRCLFSFFDQSRIMLNTLCVVVVDQLDFRSCINSDCSSVSGQLCFEFVANGAFVPSSSFGALWGQETDEETTEGGEIDCPDLMAAQFAWLRGVILRLGGGMSSPTNTEEDRAKYNSCVSVSIWFPCFFEKAELIRSKEILLNYSAPTVCSLSPLREEAVFSIAPSDISPAVEAPPHHAVLVIDDSILVQKMFKRVFQSLGIECEVASNGFIGLALMKTRHFDIVFVDFIMPEQGGVSTIQMFSEWRMNKLYSGMFVTGADVQEMSEISSVDDPLLIVGMSGTYDHASVMDGFRNGIRVFLMKPVSRDKCKEIYDAKLGGLLRTEYAGRQLSDLPDDIDYK
jgi:CheY-like chemotaxis protein